MAAKFGLRLKVSGATRPSRLLVIENLKEVVEITPAANLIEPLIK